MLYKKLYCVPTDETRAYMSQVLASSSIDIDLNSFRLEIITTLDEIAVYRNRVYRAYFKDLSIWYDSSLQRSSLILSLDSPDLLNRALELNQEGVIRAWYDQYYPYMVIRENMPPLSNNTRRMVLATTNAFAGREEGFSFTNEYVEDVNITSPTDYEYMQARAGM